MRLFLKLGTSKSNRVGEDPRAGLCLLRWVYCIIINHQGLYFLPHCAL